MNMLKINGRDLKILVAGRRGTLGNRDGKMEPGIGRERGQRVTGRDRKGQGQGCRHTLINIYELITKYVH